MENDSKFMKKALIEAKKAYKKQEVPVGAVLVLNGQIIARGYNQTEIKSDPTQHAEIICLQKASRKLKNWRLPKTTLYSTLAPCPMCFGAILRSRVARVVCGASDKRCEVDGGFINLFSLKQAHQIKITSGILEQECSEIIVHFFKQRRKKKRMENVFDDLIRIQKKRLLLCAQRIVPGIIEDDLLQPNDFPSLELHPHFRYEEGVLEGLLTARMAYLSLA